MASHVAASRSQSKPSKVPIPITRVVVSVCAGRCETESQAKPTDLVVCFDVDKRAMLAGKFAYKYVWPRTKRNVIFHHHNMATGLKEILANFRASTGVEVVVLFQHPSPSGDRSSRGALAAAGRDCVSALLLGHASEMHFVFDCHSQKNTWTGAKLQKHCLSKCDVLARDSLAVSNPVSICDESANTYNHPVFGTVDRRGWALMRKGEEVTFKIVKKQVLLEEH